MQSPVGSPSSSISSEEEETRKSILKRFIAAYKSMPELWNITLRQYSDRDKKRRGYEALLQIYVRLKAQATIEYIKKQINTLRSNYRKQLKKIKDSKRTGSSAESVYEPSLWIFYELQFLADVQIPEKGRSSIKQNERSEDMQQKEGTDRTEKATKRKATGNQDNQDRQQLLSMAREYLTKDDEYPIGKIWEAKLKSLIDPQQRRLAEKYINDILFEANRAP
ncbi:uncharacterized protein LOC126739530 [Anthonomus grandis grandis]|uniref:uncharacterized protein LOC126739530 n=1 Tax=Anthonomus grandis grandis TaxID=2921223 RepID=UPI00216699BF|nr:uncharacterized protein LOC126739530 [Anthonomus grandis grandis]